MLPLITFPEQCLELLGEPVNVALPLLTSPPPLPNTVAQQYQEPTEYHPLMKSGMDIPCVSLPSRPSLSLGTSIPVVWETGFTAVLVPMALARVGDILSSTAQR